MLDLITTFLVADPAIAAAFAVVLVTIVVVQGTAETAGLSR